jgi:hypothetical protein
MAKIQKSNGEDSDINPDRIIANSCTIRRQTVVTDPIEEQFDEPDIDDCQPQEPEPIISSAIVPPPKRQEHKESSGRRRGLPSYRDVFVIRNEIKHRQCVYISHEVHALVSSLVRALVEQGGEITVGGYIDKVLHEHLQAYKDVINELYRSRRPELVK